MVWWLFYFFFVVSLFLRVVCLHLLTFGDTTESFAVVFKRTHMFFFFIMYVHEISRNTATTIQCDFACLPQLSLINHIDAHTATNAHKAHIDNIRRFTSLIYISFTSNSFILWNSVLESQCSTLPCLLLFFSLLPFCIVFFNELYPIRCTLQHFIHQNHIFIEFDHENKSKFQIHIIITFMPSPFCLQQSSFLQPIQQSTKNQICSCCCHFNESYMNILLALTLLLSLSHSSLIFVVNMYTSNKRLHNIHTFFMKIFK